MASDSNPKDTKYTKPSPKREMTIKVKDFKA